MDKMQEEFEVFCKKHNYRTDKSKLGGYVYHVTSSCWDAWQASRQALVVELPTAFDSSKEDASYYEYAYLQTEVEKSLDAAGVAYK